MKPKTQVILIAVSVCIILTIAFLVEAFNMYTKGFSKEKMTGCYIFQGTQAFTVHENETFTYTNADGAKITGKYTDLNIPNVYLLSTDSETKFNNSHLIIKNKGIYILYTDNTMQEYTQLYKDPAIFYWSEDVLPEEEISNN